MFASTGASEMPWVEKHRPRTVSEVRQQESAVALFRDTIRNKHALNLLLHGPPGSGKTSMCSSVCHQLYGDRRRKHYVLEVNASYDREKTQLQKKLVDFCSTFAQPFHNDEFGEIDFKMVILDESDSLADDAQNMLHRIMERFSVGIRFCLLCNYIDRIVPAIVSRSCVCFFQRLDRETSISYMREICAAESVQISDDSCLSKIYDSHSGDLRKCVSVLEVLSAITGRNLQPRDVDELLSPVPFAPIAARIAACATLPDVLALSESLVQQGMTPRTLVRGLLPHLPVNSSTSASLPLFLSQFEKKTAYVRSSRLLMLEACLAVWCAANAASLPLDATD